MTARWTLVAVSAAQLAAGAIGRYVALRDRRPFDVPVHWQGRPERVGRDSWLLGTGLSAPGLMLGVQAAATARLAAGPSAMATRTLGVLGACMVGGYLIEREVRSAMTPTGFDPVVTSVVSAGLVLAASMAALAVALNAGQADHSDR